MKWITRIALENYRAFGERTELAIPPGHHLLIYGENGSGKTSLYSALRDFFVSAPLLPADAAFPFELNRFQNVPEQGTVSIDVSDDVANTNIQYNFTNDIATTNNRIPDFVAANRVRGFLDYRRMLLIHALSIKRAIIPNMFETVVEQLLGEHEIPDPRVMGGAAATNISVKDALEFLRTALCDHTSRNQTYINALPVLAQFNGSLDALVDTVATKAELYLQGFFKAGIVFGATLTPITVIREDFQKKRLKKELRFGIVYDGEPLTDYHYFLNEARLSAIALSIYLAGIKLNATPGGTLKVLYLDDVFIGMDTSNRLPLLDLLRDEFIRPIDGSEPTQVIVSTYDRQWYEVIKRQFGGHRIAHTKHEFYRLKEGGHDRPLVLPSPPSEENFDNAIGYLRSNTKPDYPAAANYLRKYAEELVQKFLPEHEVKDYETKATIKEHKVGRYVEIAIRLYDQFSWNTDLLLRLLNLLPTLLHPLSHYELSTPVYREELEDAVEVLRALKAEFIAMKKAFQILVTPRAILAVFQLNATDTDTCEVVTDTPFYAVKRAGGSIFFIQPQCLHKKTIEERTGQKTRYVPNTHYASLDVAYANILATINERPGQVALVATANTLTEWMIHKNGNVSSIQDKVDALQWPA